MAERLIFHTGMTKSGSTALQDFFCRNRSQLREMGIDYYEPVNRWRPGPSNAFFLKVVRDAEMTRKPERLRSLEEERRQLSSRAGKYPVLLLSDECFWALRAYGHRRLRAFFQETVGGETDVVIYLRRQDEWALSQWKEMVKSSKGWIQSFSSYLDMLNNEALLNYDSVLRALEEVFGKEHVIPRIYEGRRFEGSDIFHDFCAAAGIPWTDAYLLHGERQNMSLSINDTQALLLLRKLKLYRGRDWETAGMKRYIAAHPIRGKEHILTPGERRALLDRYEEGNRRIAERYFGRSRLFDDEITGKVYRGNRLRVLWSAFRIALSMGIFRIRTKKTATEEKYVP